MRRPVEPHGSREAASTAVAESEGRILDGVAIRFRQDEGTFEVPVDLMEAHQLRLRVDDLLCIRWPLPCRRRLLEEAFQTLASDGAVGRAGLRKLALFTGLDGRAKSENG
ncbi:unnamed protein product [Effrenium voratum]|uniref:Uncharacterized protein n=1 Tax=Effrenium voratum TaxID=2562239 RepID=A0AA36NH35_9DINO|nr:unnamed protein product [Effrenium voratum]